jgi:hypothetical protein
MSGTAKPGHGSVMGGGPASSHPVTQSKNPFALQLQVVEQLSPGAPAVPHPSPGEHAAPWAHSMGGGGLLHIVMHWL